MIGLLTNGTVKSSTCVHKALIRWDQSTPGFVIAALGWVSRAPAPSPVPPRKMPSKTPLIQGFVAFSRQVKNVQSTLLPPTGA
jgi:hypothetical protein|tara:strand:- start:9 stop:257 length:249 start_codon:yes stop_codon:yes gene_type:complete